MERGNILRAIGFLICALFIAAITAAGMCAESRPENREEYEYEAEEAPQNDSEIIARVVVDAGHGGFDAGASGKDSGVREDEINLSVARLLRVALESNSIEVIMTREDSGAIASTKREDMRRRSEILNTPGIDLTVSIHMNTFSDRSVSGPMVFYMGGSSDGERLASDVIKTVCESVDRSVRTANPGDYYVLREGYAPAIIVECGFLSNSEDERNLQDPVYQQKLAYGICSGILNYLGV